MSATVSAAAFPGGAQAEPAAHGSSSGWVVRAYELCLRVRGWARSVSGRPKSAPRLLSITEKLDLGPKKSLLLIACGERRFLVASGGDTIAAMLEIGAVGPGAEDFGAIGSGLSRDREERRAGRRSAMKATAGTSGLGRRQGRRWSNR